MSKINWQAVRDEYIAGDESLAAIAKRLGVSTRAVEKHASGSVRGRQTWGALREAHRAEVSRKCTEELVERQAAAAVETQARHIETLRWLAELSKANIEQALARCSAKEKVRFGLAIIGLERRVHGLDRVQLEISGKDGQPIEHAIAPLDERTQALAAQFLEQLFGRSEEIAAPAARRRVRRGLHVVKPAEVA